MCERTEHPVSCIYFNLFCRNIKRGLRSDMQLKIKTDSSMQRSWLSAAAFSKSKDKILITSLLVLNYYHRFDSSYVVSTYIADINDAIMSRMGRT